MFQLSQLTPAVACRLKQTSQTTSSKSALEILCFFFYSRTHHVLLTASSRLLSQEIDRTLRYTIHYIYYSDLKNNLFYSNSTHFTTGINWFWHMVAKSQNVWNDLTRLKIKTKLNFIKQLKFLVFLLSIRLPRIHRSVFWPLRDWFQRAPELCYMYLCHSQRGHKSGSCGSVDTRFGILRVLREIIISDYLTPFSKICLIL